MPTNFPIWHKVTATGNVTAKPSEVLAVYGNQNATAGAGAVTLRDTDGSGNIQFEVDTPTGAKFVELLNVGSSRGIPFPGGVHLAVATNMDAVYVLTRPYST